MTDPFGMVERRCREIDAVLDRIEHAGRPATGAADTAGTRPVVALVTGPGGAYTELNVVADVELFRRFHDEVWPLLDHRRQRHYEQRIASIQRERHRHDIVNG